MSKAHRTDIITIITIALLAFGLQIPWLGFFQDDWNFVFYSHTGSTQGLWEFLLVDGRPGATWVYALGFGLLGYTPYLWQIFSLLLRVLTTLVFWMILNNLWPRRTYGNLVAAVFFLVYPFFTLQPQAVTYAQHFMAFFLYGLSIYLMMKAIQNPQRYLWYSVPAVLFTFVHLFTVEYFVGLEFLRPFVIWFVLRGAANRTRRETLQKVFLTWLPYLLAFGFFVAWRSFFLPGMGARNAPLEIFSDSGNVIFSVIRNVVADWVLMFFSSWFALIDPELFVVGPIRNVYFLAITLIGAVFFYVLATPRSHDEQENGQMKGVFIAAALIYLTGMASAYAVGYIVHIKLAPWNSRFALPALPGLALMASGLIESLITSKHTRHLFFAITVGLLIGWHNSNTLNFKTAWEKQSRLYEQLIWRAPSIQPGTAIIANEEILGYMGDYPTAYGINTIYGAEDAKDVPLWFFALSENFHFSAAEATGTGELTTQRAAASFYGSKEDVIFISYEPEDKQCLWILRPEDSEYKYLPAEMKKAALFSKYSNIHLQESEHGLYDTIVNENKNTWCYFYQKADLSRQLGDSETIAALWQEAQSKDFQPANGFEYIVFIEAFADLGKWEEAYQLTRTANRATQGMYLTLCPTWQRLAEASTPDANKDPFVKKAYDLLGCAPE